MRPFSGSCVSGHLDGDALGGHRARVADLAALFRIEGRRVRHDAALVGQR